ncbi:capsid assembly protein [Vibrio phage VP3]|uniref:Capsid assembly protein n=2 Tax=Chatterjeevirus VP4 TaxID=2733614 RepID=H9YAI3_9CAUD|nr:head assembly [Vibrio phage VP4]AFH14435.1 capsid assembly protein [Vibrio phage VP3]
MPYSHLTNAVVSGELTEHEQAMIAAPVAVRDGDDAISIELPSEEPEVEQEEAQLEDEPEVEQQEGESESEEGEAESELEIPDVDPKDITEAGAALTEAQEGQKALIEQAVKNGLDAALIPAMEAEFEEHGKLSEGSYEALAAAGYSRQFVDSYIKGQQAIVTKFVESVVEYAGGREVFAKIQEAMAENQSLGAAFNAAIERNDIVTIKALIDSGKVTLRSKFGVKPKRDLTVSAKPAAQKPAAQKVEPFANRQEMVKAMSDKRYARDAAYRAQVEARVIASSF